MDPESQERFEKVDLKLLEHDEKLYAHDRGLLAIRNLLGTGMRMLVDIETKMAALADSEIRLYGGMQELRGAMQELRGGMQELRGTMQELAEAQKATAEAQKRTEDSLKRFLDRSGNGHTS
jgi:hypothetical protein